MSGITLSVVVPVFNEAEVLPELYARLTTVLEGIGEPYEIVLVNDGSRDGSLELLHHLRDKDPRVTVVALSRNFGHQLAITAGLDHARGDAVVVMDADLQDPPEVLPRMVERWRQGFQVVYGARTRRHGEGLFKRGTAAVFYRVIRKLTAIDIPTDTGDFRLMDRRAVEALRSMHERNRFVRGMVPWLGFKTAAVEYERSPRAAGETKYPIHKMVRFALDAIFSFSIAPLRLATVFGFAVSAAAFAYAAWAIYLKVGRNVSLPGWASLMVAVVFLGGVQLISLGIIGEYVGRVYDEVKGRPLYVVGELRQGAAQGAKDVRADRTAAG